MGPLFLVAGIGISSVAIEGGILISPWAFFALIIGVPYIIYGMTKIEADA